MARSLLIFLVAACLVWASCNQEPTQTNLPSSRPQLSTAQLQAALDNYLPKLQAALSENEQDSIFYWYPKVIDTYAKAAEWDSTHTYALAVFDYGLDVATTIEPLVSILDSCLKLVAPAPDTIQAKIHELSGYIHYELGNGAQMLSHYKEVAKIWEQYPPADKLKHGYNMLGIGYSMREDYPLSEAYYRSALQISKSQQDTFTSSSCLYNLGKLLLAQGEWQEAIASFEQSQALVPYDNGSFEGKLAAANLLGQRVDEALNWSRKGLELAQKTEDDPWALHNAYAQMGHTQMYLGNTNQAIRHYRQARDLAVEIYYSDSREIAKSHLFLGQAYQQNGDANLALRSFQESIKVFLPAFTPGSLRDCPAADSLLSREGYLMEALRYKGQVLEQQYHQTGQTEDLVAASRHFDAAVHFINQIKTFHTQPEAKSFYSTEYSVPYCEEAIQAHMLLDSITPEQQHLVEAYQVSRTATAFLLREAVNEAKAIELAKIPEDTVATLTELDLQIRDVQSDLATQLETSTRDSLKVVLFRLKQNRVRLLDQIEQTYPQYYELKHNLTPAPLSSLQAAIGKNELVVDYFLGEEDIYVFAYDRADIQLFRLPLDSTLYETAATFRQAVTDFDFIRSNAELAEQQFTSSSYELYNTLLDPILNHFQSKDITRLLIIPDGVLNYLSFECLLQRPSESWLETDAFLLKDYTIRYAYYADLLLAEQEEVSDGRFLGFGTEYDKNTLKALNLASKDSVSNPQLQNALRGKSLSKLLFADNEVAEIAGQVKGTAFLNSEATKTNFLEHYSNYGVIHISAHSFINSYNDSTAYIAFHQTQDSEDFLLSIPEIYGLDLQSELVSLSSCQTGVGSLQRGEGVMSLARAFNFAGCNSILTSQWSVADWSTYQMMNIFYQYLQKGMSKSEALRAAKLDYLANDEYSSPVYRIPAYWGAFILVGNDHPVSFKAANKWRWYWLALGLLALGCAGWWGYRQRLQN
ncbi:MAG: CHAT domain-containing tetratricopeptide repeat protein [Bacteroidota bacterium]